MSADLSLTVGYEALLRQQLVVGEELDAIFASGPDVMVAITADRLIVVATEHPNGWALKSIPWRLLSEVTSEPGDDQSSPASVVHLRYSTPERVAGRKVQPRETDPEVAGDEIGQAASPPNELVLVLPKPGARLARLLRARLSTPQPA